MEWYDYLIPTHLIGAIVFGIIISCVFAYLSKRESNSWSRFVFTLCSGSITSVIVAFLLNRLGYF